MRKAIWKFQLKLTDNQAVEMPAGAELLTVVEQNGIICLWAMVDQDRDSKEARRIQIIGTGNPVSSGMRKCRPVAVFSTVVEAIGAERGSSLVVAYLPAGGSTSSTTATRICDAR